MLLPRIWHHRAVATAVATVTARAVARVASAVMRAAVAKLLVQNILGAAYVAPYSYKLCCL